METLVNGLILAGISALFFLAYNHPNQYRRLAPILFTGLALIWFGCAVWWAALQRSYIAIINGVKDVDFEQLEAALSTIEPSGWLLAVGPGAGLALAGLLAWASTLKNDQKDDKGD